jgi:hypothetical protein
MMAITIWQPWASLIITGAKRFEFRGWHAPKRLIGQRIAIHAGARPASKSEIRDLLLTLHSSFWRDTALERQPAIELLTRTLMTPGLLPRSSILGTAILGQPIRDTELSAQLGLPAVNDSDRGEHSNWGWPLSAIEVLEPFQPARDAQGFWKWERES